jgi:tripartite-type tricarboxylate transporter receptor subunit TctC
MTHLSNSRRGFIRTGGVLGALIALPALVRQAPAQAAALSPMLRILCSGPAGSIPDTVARRYAEQLTGRLATQVLVDNRTGAAGQIAVSALGQSNADGATMLLAQGAIATVYPYLYAKLGYDPAVDLRPVSLAAAATLGLAVGPAVPASVTTLRELIEWGRANPSLTNFGSPGTGTLPHLLGAAFFREAQAPWQHVPFPGGPPALLDLMGGRIAALILPEGMLRQHLATGRLRVLATSAATRSEYLPEVATFVEQGWPSLVMQEWFAFFMPGAAQTSDIEVASEAIQRVAANQALKSSLAEAGMVATASTPARLAARITSEQHYWKGVVRATGIRAE